MILVGSLEHPCSVVGLAVALAIEAWWKRRSGARGPIGAFTLAPAWARGHPTSGTRMTAQSKHGQTPLD